MKNPEQVQSVLEGIVEDFQIEAARTNIEVLFGLHKAFALGSIRGVRLIYLADTEINKLADLAHNIVSGTFFNSSNKQIELQEKAEQNDSQNHLSASSEFRACPSLDAHTGKAFFSGDTFLNQKVNFNGC